MIKVPYFTKNHAAAEHAEKPNKDLEKADEDFIIHCGEYSNASLILSMYEAETTGSWTWIFFLDSMWIFYGLRWQERWDEMRWDDNRGD